MLAQYVHASPVGLFRIVRHGHRWRSLHERSEVGRYAAEHDALDALRARFPQARLPRSIDRWRFVAPLALVHARNDGEASRPWSLPA